jgi:hypothetical protein
MPLTKRRKEINWFPGPKKDEKRNGFVQVSTNIEHLLVLLIVCCQAA